MLNNLSKLMHRYASGRNVIIFFILQMLISGLLLPYFQDKFDPQRTIGLMDLSFGFTPDQGYQMLTAYGEEGRKAYLTAESIIDIIYPIIYTITNIFLLSFVFKRAFAPTSFMQKLNLFPILCLIFDLSENVGIINMLSNFPERVDAAATFASNAGLLKWACFGTSILLLLIGLVAWIIKAVNKKA